MFHIPLCASEGILFPPQRVLEPEASDSSLRGYFPRVLGKRSPPSADALREQVLAEQFGVELSTSAKVHYRVRSWLDTAWPRAHCCLAGLGVLVACEAGGWCGGEGGWFDEEGWGWRGDGLGRVVVGSVGGWWLVVDLRGLPELAS